MATHSPSPYGPGRLIRWALSPVWFLLAIGEAVLWFQRRTTLHAGLAVTYLVFGTFWTWVAVREYRLLRDRKDS